jgi:hypothetical protein
MPCSSAELLRRGTSGRAKSRCGRGEPDLRWFAEDSRPSAGSRYQRRESGDFRVASREPATAEERGTALTLAREIFSQHGIPEALLPKVRAEYVTRMYLAPFPQPSLTGSFSLDAGDDESLLHSIFFVACQPGEKLQPESLWIHLFRESQTDEEHLRFVFRGTKDGAR